MDQGNWTNNLEVHGSQISKSKWPEPHQIRIDLSPEHGQVSIESIQRFESNQPILHAHRSLLAPGLEEKDDETFMPNTWEDMQLQPPSLKELKKVITYGWLTYADNDDYVRCIHTILIAACNYSVCQAVRDILQVKIKDTSLANLFEVTTNLMRAQFNFSNAHSQNTWIIHLVDIITWLICEGIEPYIHAAMRTATSRINKSSQLLSGHHNHHVGLLMPHEDIMTNEMNRSLIKKIKDM